MLYEDFVISTLPILLSDIWKYGLKFLMMNELVWVCGLYLASKISVKNIEKSLTFAYFLGWVCIAFPVFVLGTALSKFNILGPSLVYAVFAVILLLNVFFLYRNRWLVKLAFSARAVVVKIMFAFLFIVMLWVLSFNPQIYQIERFMDFGFVATLLNSTSLPVEDVWYSGTPVNYYYFSHFIVYVMTVISGVAVEQVFFLAVCLIFAFLGVGTYEVSSLIAAKVVPTMQLKHRHLAGTLSAFMLILAGPLYIFKYLYMYFQTLFMGGEPVTFEFAQATRSIKGTISEIPFYSFITANTHAHVWGYVFAVVVIWVLINIFYEDSETIPEPKAGFRFYLLAFLLGLAFITNTWDIITLGTLSLAFAVVTYWKKLITMSKSQLVDLALTVAISALVFLLTIFWWYYYFHSPVAGIGVVKTRSDLMELFYFWGGLVALPVMYIVTGLFRKEESPNSHPIYLISSISLAFLILLETLFIKDILIAGEWYRANTYFKVTVQVWAWLSVVFGPIFLYLMYSKYLKILLVFPVAILLIGSAYPLLSMYTIKSSSQYNGISNPTSFVGNLHSTDEPAYLRLKAYRDSLPLPEKKKVIVEASGESYESNNFFSILLGWPTIIGWPVHEWTWRGSYEPIGARRAEVGEIYKGTSYDLTRDLLKQYKVDFIVVGTVERRIYQDQINYEKLQHFSETFFDNGGTLILKVSKAKLSSE